jgi:putative addiction module component (TIGR02574 family)
MSPDARRILDEALNLSHHEREGLVLSLARSLDRHPDYDEYWSEEIKRRLDEIAAGTVEMIPGRQVAAMMDAVIRGEPVRPYTDYADSPSPDASGEGAGG